MSDGPPAKKAPPPRITAVDALRGLAVILMVEQHLGTWLVDRYRYMDQLRAGFLHVNLLGGAAAPLFITLSGVGVALARKGERPRTEFVFRGVVLLLFGFALNLLVPSWFSWGSFYVLQLIGVSFCIAPWVSRLSSAWLSFLGVSLLALTVVLQTAFDTPIKLTNAMMSDVGQPGGPLRLALLEGHFPIFPWLSLFLGGLVAGRLLSKGNTTGLWSMALVCGTAAGVLRLLVFVVPDATRVLPFRSLVRLSFYPATTVFLLTLFAVALALLALFSWWEARGSLRSGSWVEPLGRTSLTLLFVHVVVFREGLERLGWRHELSPGSALLIIVSFLAAWTLLAKFWKKNDYVGSLEWWMRRMASRRQHALRS